MIGYTRKEVVGRTREITGTREEGQDAPYLLEPLAGNLEEEEVEVRLALLTAAAKLFFKRPPECQRLLGLALSKAVSDPNQDVHDRALFYTRSVLSPNTTPLFNTRSVPSPHPTPLFCTSSLLSPSSTALFYTRSVLSPDTTPLSTPGPSYATTPRPSSTPAPSYPPTPLPSPPVLCHALDATPLLLIPGLYNRALFNASPHSPLPGPFPFLWFLARCCWELLKETWTCASMVLATWGRPASLPQGPQTAVRHLH